MTIQRIESAIGRAGAASASLEKLREQERALLAELEPAKRAVAEAEPALDQALAEQRLDGGSAAASKRAHDELTRRQLALREINASLGVIRERVDRAEAEMNHLDASSDGMAREMAEPLIPLILERMHEHAATLGDLTRYWYQLSGCPTGDHQLRGHDLARVLFEHGLRCLDGAVTTGNASGYDLPPTADKVLGILRALERLGLRLVDSEQSDQAKAAE